MEKTFNSDPVVQRPNPPQEQLKVVEAHTLHDRIRQINDDIARRAYELFEMDGGSYGRDLLHWFQAEGEILHPAHMRILESDDAVTVKVEVPGFSVNELEVSLEPRRLTISGKRESSSDGKAGGDGKTSDGKSPQTVYQEHCSEEVLRVVDLPADVDVSKATAALRNGILELNMPKVTQVESKQLQVKAASGGA